MPSELVPTGSAGSSSKALPDFKYPSMASSKAAQSSPDFSRRHSLPLHFLPPNLWSRNTSSASLVESEEAARGEHILDEATVADRISALRQLNGATRSRHRYAKSTGASNSTFSQPVIVRTYSGARPRSQQRDIVTVKKDNGMATKSKSNAELKLPPVEAFSYRGIMEEIKHGVSDDLERIAEICARSKYSLSNQYEVHMPPHGRGEAILQTASSQGQTTNGGGPTLQAVGSDDEQSRFPGRVRGGRRTKSVAYGTLETIMSSSRSSDEDKSRKKPAGEIAEEIRGRVAKKQAEAVDVEENVVRPETAPQRPAKHVRSRSATFASIMIDNAQGSKGDIATQLVSPTLLISEPARPRTSTATDLGYSQDFDSVQLQVSAGPVASTLAKPSLIRNESTATTLRPNFEAMPSLFENISYWLPWNQSSDRNVSHAEGSLRELLKSTDIVRKGKGVDRSG